MNGNALCGHLAYLEAYGDGQTRLTATPDRGVAMDDAKWQVLRAAFAESAALSGVAREAIVAG